MYLLKGRIKQTIIAINLVAVVFTLRFWAWKHNDSQRSYQWWIQVISAIPAIMRLCTQIAQKTPHEVFGNTPLSRAVVEAVHDSLNLAFGNILKTAAFGEILPD
jgi:hypothetical protein